MKKVIKINESTFNRLFNILNESTYDSTPEINDKVYSVAEKFEKYAQEIKMFVEKYNVFYQTLTKVTNKLGLVLTGYEDGSNDFYESPGRGFISSYYFSFSDGQINTANMDDEAFEQLSYKYEEAKNVLEDEINPSFFEEVCRVSVRNLDESIEVRIEFNLWQ
jgi:hypothetical protein